MPYSFKRSLNAFRWLLLCAACLAVAGCSSVWRQGPVSRSVAESRQLTQLGMAAIERGDWQLAENELSKAIAACPTDAEARLRYAETQLAHGRPQVAIEHLEEARRLSNDDPRITTRAGEVYLTMGRAEEAAQRADLAIARDPGGYAAWALRGRAMRALQRPSDSLADLQRALSHRPDDPQLMAEIAELHRQLNQPRRALLALQSCCETYRVGEEPTRLLEMQGEAFAALGRYDDAVDVYAACAAREPTNPGHFFQLARVRYQQGDAVGSESALRQALALDPRHAPSLRLAEQMNPAVAALPLTQR